MSYKRRLAKEWLYLLIFLCIGVVVIPPVLSADAAVVVPTNKFNDAKSLAWWNKYSQSELEDYESVYLKDEIKEDIQKWNEVEQNTNFLKKPLFEKTRLRTGYFNTIKPELFVKRDMENAEKTFYKMIMENEILWMKENDKWIEPNNPESLMESNTRWGKMWLSS